MKFPLGLPLVLAVALLTACGGGTRLIKNAAPPPAVAAALAAGADGATAASLDWVIVREGPGSWARNADWDEYLLRVRNVSAQPLQVTGVTVFDSMGHANAMSSSRSALVYASRVNSRRYEASGLRVAAGHGGVALAAAGATASYVGVGIGSAGVIGGGAAAAAGGLLLMGPTMVTMAIMRSVRKSAVSKRMVERSTRFPLAVGLGQEQALDVFFPLSPSPTRVDIHYSDSAGAHSLSIDTAKALAGLHLDAVARK